MKTTNYTVYFNNGKERNVNCNGLTNAAIIATAFAIEQALDPTISKIIDNDKGTEYSDIELNVKYGKIVNK